MNEKKVREEWEKRDDAYTLARAEMIKADKERLADAQEMAKKIANEEIDRVKGIMKVAGKQLPKKPTNVVETPNTEKTHEYGVAPTSTQQFNKRGYRNPACIGRL